MPGEGSMLHMILSYKHNSELLSKPNYFDLKHGYRKALNKQGLVYKTASREQLREIRNTMLAEHKKARLRKLLALLVSAIITAGTLWAVWALLLIVMEN